MQLFIPGLDEDHGNVFATMAAIGEMPEKILRNPNKLDWKTTGYHKDEGFVQLISRNGDTSYQYGATAMEFVQVKHICVLLSDYEL